MLYRLYPGVGNIRGGAVIPAAEVLKRLKNYGFRVKKNKCAFLKESVEYLGHKVDASGLHPLSGKVEAIVQAPEPQNIQQ